jgi:hypothetical protein
MKTNREKTSSCFRWIRAAKAKIHRETKGMTDDEYCAYIRARALEVDESLPKFTPEEADRKLRAILYPENEPTPSRRSKAPSRTPTRRRKVAKHLAHA